MLDDLRNRFAASTTAPINAGTLSQPSTLSFIGEDVAAAAASAIPVAPTVAAPGAPYSAMYAFGDSLTRYGQCVAGHVRPAAGIAALCRPQLQQWPGVGAGSCTALGLPPLQPSLAGGTDFAYGGAETGQTPTHTLNPTDLPSQFAQFLTQVPSPQAGALYAVWIGSNDVLDIANNGSLTPDQQQADVAAAVNNEVSVIGGLAAHGAQNLLVLNVPDLGKTPDEMSARTGGGAIGVGTCRALQRRAG